MNANETKMWRHIQPRIHAHARQIKVTRIETRATARGVSDLYARHSKGRAWIELKYAKLTPSAKKLDLTHFNADQRTFLDEESKVPGGEGWLLIRSANAGWFLLRAANCVDLPNRVTAAELMVRATRYWDGDINVRELIEAIKHF